MDTAPNPSENPVSETAKEPPSKPRFPFALLFLMWVLIVITAVLATAVMPESFMSSARIRIEGDHADIPGLAECAAERPYAYDPYFLQTEFETIQSELVLGPAIQKLNLNQEWGRRYGDGNPLKTFETLALLKSRMELRPIRNTSLIEIRVFSEKVEEAAKLANEIAEVYQVHRRKARTDRLTLSINELERAHMEYEKGIRSLRTRIAGLPHAGTNADTVGLEDSKRQLDELLRVEQMLNTKIAIEKTDILLPATRMVEIVEKAMPRSRPVRPNKPLNVISGIVIGGVAGLVLATLVYWLQVRVYWRRTKSARTPFPPRFRAIAHCVTALIVGLIIGYNCATPLDSTSIIVTLVSLILGGLASAWIELANAGPAAREEKGRPALERW